eukprot:Stramenopile-MAST_4_protein_3313
MKAFFLGKRGRHDLAEEAVPRIHFTHDGKEYDFTAEEVDQMLGVCKPARREQHQYRDNMDIRFSNLKLDACFSINVNLDSCVVQSIPHNILADDYIESIIFVVPARNSRAEDWSSKKLISEGYGWDDNEEADLLLIPHGPYFKLTFSKEFATAEAKSDVLEKMYQELEEKTGFSRGMLADKDALKKAVMSKVNQAKSDVLKEVEEATEKMYQELEEKTGLSRDVLTDKDALKEAAMSKAGKWYECAWKTSIEKGTYKQSYTYMMSWIIMRLIWNSTGYWPWETDVNKAGEYRRKLTWSKTHAQNLLNGLTDATRKEGMYNESRLPPCKSSTY